MVMAASFAETATIEKAAAQISDAAPDPAEYDTARRDVP
jgi:hypothetical protein